MARGKTGYDEVMAKKIFKRQVVPMLITLLGLTVMLVWGIGKADQRLRSKLTKPRVTPGIGWHEPYESRQSGLVGMPEPVLEISLEFGEEDQVSLNGMRRLPGYVTAPKRGNNQYRLWLLDEAGKRVWGRRFKVVRTISTPPPLAGERAAEVRREAVTVVITTPDTAEARTVAVANDGGRILGQWPIEAISVQAAPAEAESVSGSEIRLNDLISSGEMVLTSTTAIPVTEEAVDIVFVGDDYPEQYQFDQDAERSAQNLIRLEPMMSQSYQIRFHRVFSNQDFECQYLTYSPRTIICNEALVWQTVNQAQVPADAVVVLVNNPSYGGSGGTIATAYNGEFGPEVVAHELGHVLGRLVDEYVVYPGAPESGLVRNCTAHTPPEPGWVGLAEAGDYASGCLYTGWYKSSQTSLMREITAPWFNRVSQRLISVELAYLAQPPLTLADFDHDGDVDWGDRQEMIESFGQEVCRLSVAGECVIDIFDVNQWRQWLGE